jgi:hypothetical protein
VPVTRPAVEPAALRGDSGSTAGQRRRQAIGTLTNSTHRHEAGGQQALGDQADRAAATLIAA